MHAADVTQSCMVCIKNSNFQALCKLSDMDLISIYIGGMIHDFKHPGLNNGFLINTAHELSTRYNDISVLENHHIAEAFKIIRSEPKFDIFCMLNKEEKKSIRKKIVECVLATDMTSHARYYQMIKLKVERFEIKQGKNSDQIFNPATNDSIPQTQQDFCSLILHFCDIANPAKPFDVYKNWMNTVMEEFFRQGDKERQLGIPISFLCDRNTVSIEGSQIGFIDGIVLPFAIPIIEIFPTLAFFTKNLNENKNILKLMKEAKEKVKEKEIAEKDKDKEKEIDKDKDKEKDKIKDKEKDKVENEKQKSNDEVKNSNDTNNIIVSNNTITTEEGNKDKKELQNADKVKEVERA